jgi:hypothetical protein
MHINITQHNKETERDTHSHSDLGMKLMMMMVGLLSLKVFVGANIIPARTIIGMTQNANKTHLTSTDPRKRLEVIIPN